MQLSHIPKKREDVMSTVVETSRLRSIANINLYNYTKKQKRGRKNGPKKFVPKPKSFGTNQASFTQLYFGQYNPNCA